MLCPRWDGIRGIWYAHFAVRKFKFISSSARPYVVRASRNSRKSQVEVTIACVEATIPPSNIIMLIKVRRSSWTFQPPTGWANNVRISGIPVLFTQMP